MIRVFKKFWMRRDISFRVNSYESEISVGMTTTGNSEHTQCKLHYFQKLNRFKITCVLVCLMVSCIFSLIT